MRHVLTQGLLSALVVVVASLSVACDDDDADDEVESTVPEPVEEAAQPVIAEQEVVDEEPDVEAQQVEDSADEQEGADVETTDEDEGVEVSFPPSFERRFVSRLFGPTGPSGDLWSLSSPQAHDLNGDGVRDIVFGTGFDRTGSDIGTPGGGSVVAVSGKTNDVLWRRTAFGDAYTTPVFSDLNGNGKPDVLMGGREGFLAAYGGQNGQLLWRADPSAIIELEFPYNFYTPVVIDDVTDDGIDDVVVTYGGDPHAAPETDRDPGFIVVLSGASGELLHKYETPDGAETYSSPVLYERPDGTDWIVFGTGGDTHAGSAWRAPVSSLIDGSFPRAVERLVAPAGNSGIVAPLALADITQDGELDIIASPFDGRTVVVEGKSGDVLWTRRVSGRETYTGAAVVVLDDEGRRGLFVSNGIGEFLNYTGTSTALLDASSGEVLWTREDELKPQGSPLAVDLTGDGVDEVIFCSGGGLFEGSMTRVHILRTEDQELFTYENDRSFLATPLIADLSDRGMLELIIAGVDADPALAPRREAYGWRLLRLELNAESPPRQTWSAYMGPESTGQADL